MALELEVNADLLVQDGGVARPLRTEDLRALPVGASTETTLAAVSSRLSDLADVLWHMGRGEALAAEGRAFVASSGRLSVPGAGNVRFAVRSPVGGRTVHLERLVAFCSAGPVYGGLRINPLIGLPAAPLRPVTNASVGSAIQSQVEVTAAADVPGALDGGIDTGLVLGLSPGRTVVDLAPLSLAPAVTLALDLTLPGPSDVILTVYWYEEG